MLETYREKALKKEMVSLMDRPKPPDGVEKGILYRKAEQLLRDYRAMVARVAILDIDCANLAETEKHPIGESADDAIAGMYFARMISDMPHGTEFGDKTANLAAEWRERYEKDFSRVWRMYVLDRENKALERVTLMLQLHKLDKAIESLLPRQQDVVKMYYVQGMSWEKIAKKLYCDVATCTRTRDKAIWYMSLSLFPRRVGNPGREQGSRQ